MFLKCANILQINRSTVAAYLNADKLFDNKWVFSSVTFSLRLAFDKLVEGEAKAKKNYPNELFQLKFDK
jgi:hypothetical protein